MNEGEDEDLQEWNQHGEYQPDFYHLYVRCGGQALTHTQEQGCWNRFEKGGLTHVVLEPILWLRTKQMVAGIQL